ncbi:hypothetical protein CHUAL_010690 [Chamberlinius hualienensis]
MSSDRTLSEQLAQLLKVTDTTDIINYMENFQSRQDLEEYLYGVLDEENVIHRRFVENYLDHWKPGNKSAKRPNLPKKEAKPQQFEVVKPVAATEETFWKETKTAVASKKSKTKYSPLFKSLDGYSMPVMQLPGRYKCECEATKHQLINNCLNCGKIVCEQEGAGPCTFCGNIVTRRGESKQTKTDIRSEGLKNAVEHKNKLLEFDQNAEKRTKIIDDEADYFNVNNRWLSKSDREALAKRDKAKQDLQNKAKNENLVTFDFAGRQIIEERNTAQEEMEREFELHLSQLALKSDDKYLSSDYHGKPTIRPIFEPSVGELKSSTAIGSGNMFRLQGNELQEMADNGHCLSLHQPYASLLIAGLKL